MRNLYQLNDYRDESHQILEMYGSYGDDTCGVFIIPSKIDKAKMRVIAAAGLGWDHVSASRANRCPNWEEMSQIRRLFFYPRETVVQFHVPEDEHISFHPFTLHLWRSWTQEYELPPPEWVGPKNISPEDLRRIKTLPPGLFRSLIRKQVHR